MPYMLNDIEINKLLGTIIINGSPDCVRPNSYIIRLGAIGEFINTNKEFVLGKQKKGIKIQPGHSAALTSFEILDFRREAVHKIYPDNDLHGFISPTTDLSREGLVAPTTQVDAGYHGSLNWTITNSSNEERRFIYEEKIFRLTIFRLEKGETPEQLYKGDYQNLTGYVRSKRKGPPVGMKESEWEDSMIKGGPEDMLDDLLKSGYPWHVLGQKLKIIDAQFKSVSDEYSNIHDSIDGLSSELKSIKQLQGDFSNNITKSVKDALKEEASILQNRWLLGAGSSIMALFGLIIAITSNNNALKFLNTNGSWIGLILILVGIIALIYILKRNR
jgi:deoxycytidine triphosphate deaminase